jgi:four helix bundle protein
MADGNDDLKRRTKNFALRIAKLVESLPNNQTARVIGNQLLRCGTAVAANYRASCRAKSKADFIAKMGIVEEETDESAFWIEMLIETNLVADLHNEAEQLTKNFVSSINTTRGGKR